MNRFSKVLAACSGTLLCLALASCGGSSQPAPAADFSLSASPTAIALVSGAAAQQISISATPLNGFAGTVAVAITGLPTGVTAQPATLTLTPGTPQTLSITAGAATPGAATLIITGTSGALSHTSTEIGRAHV